MKVRPIILAPPAVEDAFVKKAEANGYLVLLTDHSEKVRLVLPEAESFRDDLMMSALQGMAGVNGEYERSQMVLELHRRLKARESKKEGGSQA